MTQESESVETESTIAESEGTKDQNSETKTEAKADAPKKAEADPKAEEAKGAKEKDAKAKSEPKDAADAKSDDEPAELNIEYPETFGEISEENDAAFREFATKHKLSQEAVNDILKIAESSFGPAQNAAQHESVKGEMLAELKKEHGKKFDERAGAVKALLKDAGGQELIDFMDQTGGSVAKPLFNALVKIAGKLSSDKPREEPSREAAPESRTILKYDHPTSRAAAG